MDGCSDGVREGTSLGLLEGDVVGDFEGDAEGDFEGDAEGDFEGEELAAAIETQDTKGTKRSFMIDRWLEEKKCEIVMLNALAVK